MGASLSIYHTNDIHNHREIFTFFSDFSKDGKTLLLDAGDALAGSNTAFRLTEPVLHDMNRIGYDAMAMGNREFHYIREIIKMRVKEADFPILCANVTDLTGKVDDCLIPYIRREVNGIRVGIFGLTPVQYGKKSNWVRIFGFTFTDPVEAAQEVMEELRGTTDLIILLSHSGNRVDREIAESIPGIDLIIGGHTHVLLETPEKVRDTYIFQAGSHGKYVGRMTFTVSPEQGKGISDLNYELFTVRHDIRNNRNTRIC